MDPWGIVSAGGAALGGSAASWVALRGWWSRREIRQQRAFKRAVQDVVEAYVRDLLQRQAESERRQAAHLDRQDQELAALRAELGTRGRGARRD